MSEPTLQERYQHLRDNAEAFVTSIQTMVEACERDGKDDLASKLKVWCLMPWEAAIRCDDTGDLWCTCGVCGKPIKSEADRMGGEDCDFHRSCVGA